MADAGASASVILTFNGTDVVQAASEALATDALHTLAATATTALAVSVLEPLAGATAAVVA